ncbi:MAG: cation:proton antiporter [Acidobacteria bacterium]|jgi:Kef-type K+ transport system membrane component KefB|nr:cation:proton antiporter [Acidobacteriota bacterium]
MNELSSLGLILLLALGAGHLVKFARVPEVTGYILAGVVLGPSMLGWVSTQNLSALEILSEVALGLILFSVGTVFELSRFRRVGRQVLQLTLYESALAALLVTVGMLLLGVGWQAALLLGAIAVATAPASTLMVIREVDSEGPLTDSLLAIIALNNIYCIIAFSLVGVAIDLSSGLGSSASFVGTLYGALYPLVWQLAGSVALGFLVGLLLARWASTISETGETLILLGGSILFCVGVARVLELSPLIASMAVGATMVNLFHRSQPLFETLSEADPPFYAIFFVLAGADLDVSLVGSLGLVGLVYLLGRAGGKFLGAQIGARRLGMAPSVQSYLGLTLLAQAGLAVGLTITAEHRFPEVAPAVTVIVLASVAVYEMFGPIATRWALMRSGESRLGQPEELVI